MISQVKLIAEPWDVGEGGYQVGKFPVLWAEWNGKYRDTVRRYWKSDEGQLSDLGYRLTGSSDLYQHDGRRPSASINFVTAHDGFTLHDLVTYNEKHNEANGEDNRDGTNENYSWNMGVEGETGDPLINELRDRQKRNFLATLLFSQGVPMICGGDEIDRTQHGNNNAYCQDNPLSWFDWNMNDRKESLLRFTSKLIRLRRKHPYLRRRKFYQDRAIRGSVLKDILWLRPDGAEMADEEWNAGWVRCIGMMLNGATIGDVDETGAPIRDQTFLLLLNCHHEHIDFVVPAGPWSMVIDTNEPEMEPGAISVAEGPVRLVRQSLMLLMEEPA